MTTRPNTEAAKEARRRYNASPQGRASRARYAATERGREVQRRVKAKSNAKNAANPAAPAPTHDGPDDIWQAQHPNGSILPTSPLDDQQGAQHAEHERHMAELADRRAIPIDPDTNVARVQTARAALRPRQDLE